MASVDLQHLERWFDGAEAPVVVDFSLFIEDGEFLALLGPSGCGKTTVLRMIAGLDDPDRGDILIGNRSVIGLEPKDRDVALVFQQYALYPHMTADENLRYPLKAQRMSKEEQDQRVMAAAEWLNLTALLDRFPGDMSGGEQQRVALGRATVREPEVYLLDEPLANLDALLRLQTRTRLKALQRESGATTIMVTHDQSEAMAMANRIAVMQSGRIQQVGTPDEIYQSPANLFVAGFIGSPPANLVSAEVQDRTVTLCGVWTVPGVFPASDGAYTGGFRPEEINLSLEAVPDGQAAMVFLTQPQGSETIIDTIVGEESVRVRVAPQIRPAPGDTVFLRVAPDKVRLYERETGDAIGVGV